MFQAKKPAKIDRMSSLTAPRTVTERLTDRELSGAARLPIREAGQASPTRPLERVVRPHQEHAEKGNTKPTERRCSPKPERWAKDREAEVNAGGRRLPFRVRTSDTVHRTRTAGEGKEPPTVTKPPMLDAKRKETLSLRRCCPEN